MRPLLSVRGGTKAVAFYPAAFGAEEHSRFTVFHRAVAAGGREVFAVENQSWGVRQGRLVDPYGPPLADRQASCRYPPARGVSRAQRHKATPPRRGTISQVTTAPAAVQFGFEVRGDVDYGGMHWITVGPSDQPGTSIVLYPPAATPGITDDERQTIAEMMAKGTYASINLATTDLDGTFERLQAGDAEVVHEPTEQPYGVRDCAFRDPAGN